MPVPPSKLPRAVIALGVVSLFTDLSSEMIVPLLPAFLTLQLGATATFFGLVEGVAETVAALLKLFSGAWSDRSGNRRPLVLFGYSLSAVMRPMMALCTAPWQALVVRASDRVGKGLRSAPRDALLTAATAPESRGWAFGFHRAMDHIGAMLGALLATILLSIGLNTRQVFWVAAIPGVFAVLAILFGVKEAGNARSKLKASTDSTLTWSQQPAQLRRYLMILAIFTLANSSDAFLLLKASEAGIALKFIPLLWIVLHLTKAVTNLAGGHLSDRIGALPVIRGGWLVYGAVYALFGFASSAWQVWVLFALYGLYHGLTEGAEKALVGKLAPPEQKGVAFGWYHAICGIVALPASLGTGFLWEHLGSRTALISCGALAFLATALIGWLAKDEKIRAADG
ncbi:MAG: MFS transporter [Verrucomicrobia bacterium]|nr:MFS transporter [Verrucomicrobiota bacterium]